VFSDIRLSAGDRNDYCVEKPLKDPSNLWHTYSTKLGLYCIHHRLQCVKQQCVTGRLEVLSVEVTDTDVNGRGFQQQVLQVLLIAYQNFLFNLE